MLVQFGNNWIQKIPLTAKLDSAYGLVQFWLSSEFFSSNYFQIGQHVVLLHIQIHRRRSRGEGISIAPTNKTLGGIAPHVLVPKILLMQYKNCQRIQSRM